MYTLCYSKKSDKYTSKIENTNIDFSIQQTLI